MFCKHKWEIVTETTLPSAFEQLADRAIKATMEEGPLTMFQKVHIVILKCTKCGRTKQFRNTNP